MSKQRGIKPVDEEVEDDGEEEAEAERTPAKAKDYDSDDLKVKYALTDEETAICQQIVVHGFTWLRYEKGWSAVSIRRFTGRGEVQAYLKMLQEQYGERKGIQERTQFFAQVKINSMVPAALNIIARSLRGDVVKDDGEITRAPSRQQFEASLQVLDRANIQGSKYGGAGLPSIDARTVNVITGDAADAATSDGGVTPQGRERIRRLLSNVVNKLTSADKADDHIAARNKKRKQQPVVEDD